MSACGLLADLQCEHALRLLLTVSRHRAKVRPLFSSPEGLAPRRAISSGPVASQGEAVAPVPVP